MRGGCGYKTTSEPSAKRPSSGEQTYAMAIFASGDQFLGVRRVKMAASSRGCLAMHFRPALMLKTNVVSFDSSRIFSAVINSKPYSTALEVQPVYPNVKPEFPPGAWGNMSPKMAWKWFQKGKLITDVQALPERLLKIEASEPKNRYKVYALTSQPKLLDYRQYITKTHLLYELPQVYKELPSSVNIASLKSAVEELISDECFTLNRQSPSSPDVRGPQAKPSIDKIMSVLLARLSHVQPQLCSDQVDLNVNSNYCWHRRTPKSIRCRGQAKDLDPDCARFMYSGKVHFQIRSERPLTNIAPLSDSLCRGGYPLFDYTPSCLGQFTTVAKARQLPGFLYGDPCQYSVTAVLDSSSIKVMKGTTGDAVYNEALVGAGVVLPFGILSGEAYYDGFTQYEDIAQPMTMQTIVTDGKEFSFSVYQLNTLRLFVDDDANPLRNLCWTSGAAPLKLYDDITPDGKVNGFNVDVLSKLVAFLLRERNTAHLSQRELPSGELFPYRPRYERWTDIPVMMEGSANIPTPLKYRKGLRTDGRPHGSKKTLLDCITGKRMTI